MKHARPISLLAAFLAGLMLLAPPAAAWSPGPYPLARMAVESDACLVGTAKTLRRGVHTDNAFEVSIATLDVDRWVFGAPPASKKAGVQKRVDVVYFSRTATVVDVAYTFLAGERVLLCGVYQSAVGKRAPRLAGVKAGLNALVLRFAKARNLGYKLTVLSDGTLKGFSHPGDAKKLAAAEKTLRDHQPAPAHQGLRAQLWLHGRTTVANATIHPTLTLTNVGLQALRLPSQALPSRVAVYVIDTQGRAMGWVRGRTAMKKATNLTPEDRVRWTLEADLETLKLKPGVYWLRATYFSPGGSGSWNGKLQSNRLAIAIR